MSVMESADVTANETQLKDPKVSADGRCKFLFKR